MNIEFEWTESGCQLLRTIEKIIEDNGGIDPYYLMVYDEVYNTNTFKRISERNIEIFNIKKKYGMSRKEAMTILNMNISQYESFTLAMNKVNN